MNFERCISDEKLEDKDSMEQIKELLVLASSLHHAFLNFSLMPVTGGLNNIKGGRKIDDRLDIFLYKLKNAYNVYNKGNKSDIDLPGIILKTGDALKDFLKKIGSFERYCEVFYHLDEKEDKELFQALFSNSAKEIKNTEDLIQYIGLAVQYWEHQVKIFEKRICEKNCKEIRK